ncbi:hypothetical protein CC79DRAFT_1294587 [Sarocladium strictum]
MPREASTPQRPVEDASTTASVTGKRVRARHACRECNARRVKCNVTVCHPCFNCKSSGARCEVLPSRRGRYKRNTTKKNGHDRSEPVASSPDMRRDEEASTTNHPASPPHTNVPDASLAHSDNASDTGVVAESPSPELGSTAPATLFYGESNPLTLVSGGIRQGEQVNSTEDRARQKARLHFPIHHTPQSMSEQDYPANIDHLSASTSRYLQDEGALTLPETQACVSAFQAYFTWFHPCFPILDRVEFTRKLGESQASYLLLQSMLFIGATYCDDETITAMGFSDRTEAKSLLYTRARLLFHADWEKDQITLIQSLFLMSFWRGGPSDVRDVRYWLGVVIGVAESHGLHRSTRFATRDPSKARIRKRIWWSIYVRERQSAASLGLPSRIRDDDCDVEPLRLSDLESETTSQEPSPFGSCKPEHMKYALAMVNLAQILGKVVDLHFAPGRKASTPEQLWAVDKSLWEWKDALPEEINRSVEDGTASVWGHLLHLAYNHLRILIHRHNFVKQDPSNASGQIVVKAASKISRIAEDMLTQGTLRYGQMHTYGTQRRWEIQALTDCCSRITSLFAALCIHTISIKRNEQVARRIAESRAQMCLLGLQEIQKYWRINNNVLDLFLQYLDVSIAQRLHGTSQAPGMPHLAQGPVTGDQQGDTNEPLLGAIASGLSTPRAQPHSSAFEDQFFNLLFGPWEGGDSLNLESAAELSGPGSLAGFNNLDREL